MDEDKLYRGTFLALLALVLFAQHCWQPGFFHDGYLYAGLGKNALLKGAWLVPSLSSSSWSQFTQHPPLFFILEGLYFKLVGISWLTARAYTLLWAFLTMTILYYVVSHFSHKKLAFLSTLLLILLPPFFKKARSPNIDIALMTLIIGSISSYLCAYFSQGKKREILWWSLSGALFGLSLLVKGPPALLIPMTISLHLLIMKEWRRFFSPWPWCGLILGLLIFSLWPLALYSTHQFYIFQDYLFNQILSTVVHGRGRAEWMLDTYPYYLLENAGPWFLLSLWGIYKLIKERCNDPLVILFLSLYLVVLIPFSFVRWKYSNYIVPLFPAMAVLAAYPLSSFSSSIYSRLIGGLRKLLVVGMVLLLVFPIIKPSKRDPELFRFLEILQLYQIEPSCWHIVDESYPFHHVANLMAWLDKGDVKVTSAEMVRKWMSGKEKPQGVQLVLVKNEKVAELMKSDPLRFKETFSIMAIAEKINLYLLVTLPQLPPLLMR